LTPTPDQLLEEAQRVYLLGRTRRSLELLESALELAPERADLHYRVALRRLEAARVTKGVEALEQALKLDPEKELLQSEFLDPVEALLSRRPTFKNLVKLRKQLLADKAPKLRDPRA
jgi:tetratricopeptide (TPR) repeat protein